jgi:hypothetical protein
MSGLDVLIFVEDPGAANYVAPLPAALIKQGWRTTLLAEGHAIKYLREHSLKPETLRHPVQAKEILAATKPRLVVVGTSENVDTVGLELIAEARLAQIPSVGVVDAFGNTDHRFRGRTDDPLAYMPDWLLVPDEWTKAAYVALGYPQERTIVCGHPHYDYVHCIGKELMRQDRASLRKGLFPEVPLTQKIIVFAAETSTGLNQQQFQRSAEYTLQGRGRSTSRTEIVLEEFLDAVRLLKPQPYLVLRLHPKNLLEEFTPYLSEFDQINQGGSPLNLVYAADLVVGMTTLLLLEAAMLGRPTLSIIPRLVEMQWLPCTRMGITRCVMQRSQIRASLQLFSQNGSQVWRPDYSDIFVFGSLDRSVAFINQILTGKRL